MYCVLYAREKAKMKNGVDVMFMRLRVNSVPVYSTVLLAKCSDIVYKLGLFSFFNRLSISQHSLKIFLMKPRF